jgi:exodeoxyribonuclease-5
MTSDLTWLDELDIWADPPTAAPTPAPEPARPRTVGAIDLAPQQEQAVTKIADWYQNPDSQVFRLFGYAGTGKTTLARSIVEQLGVSLVRYGAFTGKAAYVLRTKGCQGASTIHSMIYQPREKLRAQINQLQRDLDAALDPTNLTNLDPMLVDRLQREIRAEERKLEKPDWILRDWDECDLPGTELLIIDEVSMVNDRMGTDLLSYGTKTLVLGDPAQLPPVEGGGYFINEAADHLLTDIHRSALDSPVTRLATAVRSAPQGDRLYGVHQADGDSGRRHRLTLDDLLSFDQVLVGTNRTRWQAIHLLRALRGLNGTMPQPGDRIICLANSSDAEVFNGQQFTVTTGEAHPEREDQYRLEVVDDDGLPRRLTTWASGFLDLDGEKKAKREGRGSVVAATFAQAVTTHKAQGSQWDNVLVVDESGVFAGMAFKDAVRVLGPAGAAVEQHKAGQRWLYTALTRAAQRVVIVPAINGILGG